MNKITEKVIDINGFKLHLIPDKKFKTINMVAKFKAPLNRETITSRALLPYILQQGTKNYPSRNEFQNQLDNLYGAVLSMDGGKKGENHIISFRLEVANQRFIENETRILEDAVELFNEVIFNPNEHDGAFESNIFNKEKETLKQKISSVIDDKLRYANMRLIDEMCKGESYSMHVHGYEEDLKSLTSENVFQYYQTLLKEDALDIYVLGDFDESAIEKLFADAFSKKTKSIAKENKSGSTQQSSDVKKTEEVIEKQSIQQAKLHIGYRTNCTYQDNDYPALQVFNGILGAFPSSKLFINVREKNSLAYYASSRIESHKGLLLVFSGIAPSDYEKAREIIELQMTAIRNGEFTEEDMSETKELIENQLLETLDNPQGIIEVLYQQIIANKSLPPEQLITSIRQVSKEDIINIANKVEEDTVYLLTSEEGLSDESAAV